MNFITILTAILIGFSQGQSNGEFEWDASPSSSTQQHLQNSDRKIFWWNVGCNITDKKIEKAKPGTHPLFKNLEQLASSTGAPQIIALGEYCQDSMPAKTLKVLQKKYSYKYHLQKTNPYKPVNNGILVISKSPIQLIRNVLLEVGVNSKENKASARYYVLLKVQDPAGDFLLSPVHLFNPWGKMSLKQLAQKAPGKDNLNYLQGEAHLNELQKDLKQNPLPLIVIGDFNSAKNVLGMINMATYSLYASIFYDRGDNQTTFPTSSAVSLGNNYHNVTIDHIFTNEFKKAQTSTIPLKGSDHYPILTSF